MSKRKYFYCKKHIAFKSIKVVMLCPIKLQKTSKPFSNWNGTNCICARLFIPLISYNRKSGESKWHLDWRRATWFCFFVFYPFRDIWECTIAFPTSPCVFCGLWECVWPHLLRRSVMLFQEFGVSGLLLQATQSLYNRSKTLVCTVNYNSDLLSIWSVKKEMMDGW